MTEANDVSVIITAILAGAVRRGTPLAFAAMGEAISERSGVLNLGVEGMMLVGAMAAVVVQVTTGNPFLAILAAGTASTALASIHALLVVRLRANQIVSGFALTILGTGISGFFGRPYVGIKLTGIEVWKVPWLSDIPFVGTIFFQHDVLVYLSFLTAAGLWFLIYRTRFGLHVRAVGEDPDSAYAQGVRVLRIRFLAIMLGGFLAGVGGAHLSIAYTRLWADQMTAGQGWIAIGLVIVAYWRPGWCLLAAWFFGALAVLHPHLQAAGVDLSSYLVAMLPYLLSVLALTIVTLLHRKKGHGLPAALAKHFQQE